MITDQQGNSRVSFEDDGNGRAIVRQENSYYPFGLIMSNGVTPATQPNKKLYNGGSEWQNDYVDLPDYYQTFFRNYDAAIGRWIGVDVQAEATESMSVYQYAGNNPVMMNDPLDDKQNSEYVSDYDPSDHWYWGDKLANEQLAQNEINFMHTVISGGGGGTWFPNMVAKLDPSILAAYLANFTNKMTFAKLNDATYGPVYSGDLDGYSQIHLYIPGVIWNNEDSGFKSSMYARFNEDGTESFVYATAGTDGLDGPDWSNNIGQIFGVAAQYDISAQNAVLINEYIAGNYPNSSLMFTGHSLGGGLAILNSIITGREAVVFNPAAVSGPTLRSKAGLPIYEQQKSYEDRITTYIMQGDPLNFIQNGGSQGYHIYVTPTSQLRLPFDQHGIKNCIKAFQNEH